MAPTNTTTDTPTFEKGSWQDSLQRSTTLLEKASKGKKMASTLLWKGATEGIEDWIENKSSSDTSGEGLYASLLEALGTSRKGDASKIKSVALAVRDKGLDLSAHDNLAKAYATAVALTRTAKEQEAEDDAAEEAIASIEAPKTASTQESAAALLLSKGVDGAVVAILDALNVNDGEQNFAAHRAFLRAVSNEINDREKAKRDAEAKAKADEAAKAKAERDAKRAEEKAKKDAERAEAAKEKAKAKGTKAAAKKAAAPKAATTKAKPKAKPAKAEPAPVEASDEAEVSDETEAPKPVAKKKAIPVRRK